MHPQTLRRPLMPNYSYKVRVLAAVDSIGPGPVELQEIGTFALSLRGLRRHVCKAAQLTPSTEAEVQTACELNNTLLPSTWKKWMKTVSYCVI